MEAQCLTSLCFSKLVRLERIAAKHACTYAHTHAHAHAYLFELVRLERLAAGFDLLELGDLAKLLLDASYLLRSHLRLHL